MANSVIDGADAVMLSGETSVGKFPVKTVETMRGIIRDIEKSEYTFKPCTKKKKKFLKKTVTYQTQFAYTHHNLLNR